MWDKFKEQFNLLKLEKKKLCLITNSDKFISNELFLDAIASAIQGGVDIVQLKETTFPDYVMAEIAKKGGSKYADKYEEISINLIEILSSSRKKRKKTFNVFKQKKNNENM